MARVVLLGSSGALGLVGMAISPAPPHPWAALAGFALVGLGFANVVPVLFSAAGQLRGVAPANGIAAASAAGRMAGPLA